MSQACSAPAAAPRHIAIIMDGNGRWARARGLPRVAGHKRGAEAVRRAVRGAGALGVEWLTLFAFSTENWRRPVEEVTELMGLLRIYIRSEIADLHANGVRLRIIGDRSRLADDIIRMIETAERQTAANTGLTLQIAINYGARQEIAAAARALAAEVAAGRRSVDAIDEDAVSQALTTGDAPDPDLLIRTSGEQRLSNFMLWQLAYAELLFLDVLWPDFDLEHLERAIREFQQRDRRYGAVAG